MEIHVDKDGLVSIGNPLDFTKLKTVVAFGPNHAPILEAAFAPGGVRDDGHLWIPVEQLHAIGSQGQPISWTEDFERMLQIADKHGWVRRSPVDLVRTHVDWQDPRGTD
jgi:hypothetical protein